MSDFKQLSRSVKGLTVLVTGAASGMGRATARVFGAEGANVAVTDYAAEGAAAVAAAITATGGAAKAWALDVADRDALLHGRYLTDPAGRRLGTGHDMEPITKTQPLGGIQPGYFSPAPVDVCTATVVVHLKHAHRRQGAHLFELTRCAGTQGRRFAQPGDHCAQHCSERGACTYRCEPPHRN